MRPVKKKKLLRQVQRQKMSLRKVALGISIAAITGAGLFLFNNIGTSEEALASPGKDGARTITSTNTIVNEYTNLTHNANSGATEIRCGSNTLNANGRFSGNLAAGDLLLIIQHQGATMSHANNNGYGEVSSYVNCGNYEFARVASIGSSGRINLSNGLKNQYHSNGSVQVVRVPRYTVLTINNGASVTAPDWDGTTGGIVAIEASATVTINGSIDVTGKGFRGGAVEQSSNLPGSTSDIRSSDAAKGGAKGESINGNSLTYNNGGFCLGAPANGGGGGNAHNCGGGGGANAGNTSLWNGNGNPSNSNSNWTTAWNLESPGFANTTSSGGGRGGYSYSANNEDELVKGPGHSDWGGDNRRNGGGLGGRPLDYSGGRIFFGGGGGAGDSNNNTGTKGGDGGGIVIILAKQHITGTGSIIANGETPVASVNDGAGGGGAGGVVILYNNAGVTSSITVSARGGNGGSQNISWAESEGAGGGGGGGYVAITSLPAISIDVAGGASGTSNSSSVTNFTPNGGTSGGAGSTASLPSTFNPYSASSNPLPVDLVYFKADKDENQVMLSWQTAAEKNNDFFAIERSADGYAFEELDRIQGAGNSSIPRNYTFNDLNPLEGTSYYRLRQVDYDGKFELFPPRAVQRESGPAEAQFRVVKIGPVPFRHQLTLELEADISGTYNFELFTNDGKLVWSDQRNLEQGIQGIDLQPQTNIPGIYLLRVTAASGKTNVSRLVKQ
jgi:hypothetical protein